MKKLLIIVTTLIATQSIAQNTILEENLASSEQPEILSTLILSSCELEILSVTDTDLRAKSKGDRLMHIKVAGKSYYASSIALFERNENRCELKLKDLILEI